MSTVLSSKLKNTATARLADAQRVGSRARTVQSARGPARRRAQVESARQRAVKIVEKYPASVQLDRLCSRFSPSSVDSVSTIFSPALEKTVAARLAVAQCVASRARTSQCARGSARRRAASRHSSAKKKTTTRSLQDSLTRALCSSASRVGST